MTNRNRLVLCALLSLACCAVARGEEADKAPPEADPAGIEFFEKKIRPVLVEKCYKCHANGAEQVRGGLLLDSRAGLLQGGDTGPAIAPGDAQGSLLLEALRYESFEMPPDGKLPDETIADFAKWIELGAPDPRTSEAPAPQKASIDFAAARAFWAFQPPQRQAQPVVKNSGWLQTPLDAFILARLEAENLSPNPEADRRTLIRRLSFDLIGLPPTPQEVEAFESDQAPGAYERLVDRLLASPHYGERRARMWLDLARYAEDQAHIVGNDRSLCYPNAYLYRDWTIDALNADVGYDRFVKLQLAADLIDPDDHANRAALGFIGLGPKYYRRNAPEVMADEWEDRVDTVSRGLLGITVACARCHDHKFDPIATEDYYALAGVFASTKMFNEPLREDCETKESGEAKDPDDALHIVREDDPVDLNVHVRGDVTKKGPVVARRFVRVLSSEEPAQFDSGSGRRELAEAIVSDNNPLAARVIVNRVWSAFFGRGLVNTPSNFGALGERPTHPELLDDLAVRFMQSGWSLKWLQREIVMSAAYRQSSEIDEQTQTVDGANLLLSRMNRRRLDAEAWRDAILSVAGRLEPTIGGASIDPDDPEETRRTVYSEVSRLELNAMLALFDFPDPNVHSERRVQTTTPLQKLFVLNSPFMNTCAGALTERLFAECPQSDTQRIERAYGLLFGRAPTNDETQLAQAFLNQESGDHASLWRQYAQVLLASNEMLMVD